MSTKILQNFNSYSIKITQHTFCRVIDNYVQSICKKKNII